MGATERIVSDLEQSLLNEIRAMKHESDGLREETEKLRLLCEKKCKEKCELLGKIKFLEGQIEAYQYCMNCKR